MLPQTAFMTAVEQLAAGLEETAAFLGAQKGLDCFKTVLEQQCAALLRRCELLPPMSPGEASGLIQKVTASSISLMSPDWTSQAVLAIGARVAAHSGGASKAARAKQQMTNFSAYLSVKDVELLENNTISNYAKLDVIANRMVRIGLDLPTETSAGHILKLLGFVFSKGFISASHV